MNDPINSMLMANFIFVIILFGTLFLAVTILPTFGIEHDATQFCKSNGFEKGIYIEKIPILSDYGHCLRQSEICNSRGLNCRLIEENEIISSYDWEKYQQKGEENK